MIREENKYSIFKSEITNSYLKDGLDVYRKRLEQVNEHKEIINGIKTASKVIRVIQNILFDEGVEYVWLVPIETSIDEYTKDNFVAMNPYNGKHYSLVQSPQIQKEAAAILIGSNFRIVDCYRGEKVDRSHAHIFQQFCMEFANKNENEIRRIASRIISTSFEKIKGQKLNLNDCYNYSDLIDLYGVDDPNLSYPYLISYEENSKISLTYHGQDLSIVSNLINSMNAKIVDEKIIFNSIKEIEKIRKIRKIFIDSDKKNNKKPELYAYWVVNMPYATKKNGIISPVHHIMSKPKQMHDENFSFKNLTDDELCKLECNSFDLMLCNEYGTVEILSGDERIHEFNHQYEAIKRMGCSVKQYAFLLETLNFNDLHDNVTVGGFGIGVERLSLMLTGLKNIDSVQLFPTNSVEGKLMHAISIEEMTYDE